MAKGRYGSQSICWCDLQQLAAPLCASSLFWEWGQCQCCLPELARQTEGLSEPAMQDHMGRQ